MKRIAATALVFAVFACEPAWADYFDPITGSIYSNAKRDDDARPRRAPRPQLHRPLTTPREADNEPIPAGPLQIVISIANQKVTLFADGAAIGQAPVSTGVPGHPTPMGIFSVISKDRYHHSNLYSNAPMPFMQRLTWSGVAMHQGPLPGYPASHGCIRLPESFAVRLWHLTKVGARVVVTRDAVAPKAFASPRLFVPRKPEEKPADPPASAAAPTPETPIKVADADGSAAVREAAAVAMPASGDLAIRAKLALATEAVPAAAAKAVPKPKGPVHVFVSRKEGKLYVRQGFTLLFSQPITIADRDRPIGTHLFTAMTLTDGGTAASWNVITIPSSYPREADTPRGKKGRDGAKAEKKPAADVPANASPEQALERIELPADAVQRISELLIPGSSLVISDNALSDETDSDTDFIVVTR